MDLSQHLTLMVNDFGHLAGGINFPHKLSGSGTGISHLLCTRIPVTPSDRALQLSYRWDIRFLQCHYGKVNSRGHKPLLSWCQLMIINVVDVFAIWLCSGRRRRLPQGPQKVSTMRASASRITRSRRTMDELMAQAVEAVKNAINGPDFRWTNAPPAAGDLPYS